MIAIRVRVAADVIVPNVTATRNFQANSVSVMIRRVIKTTLPWRVIITADVIAVDVCVTISSRTLRSAIVRSPTPRA